VVENWPGSTKRLMKHVWDRWTIENSWHCPRDTQSREGADRYCETNGV
jgi:predicted transposase YbfD/YdcC